MKLVAPPRVKPRVPGDCGRVITFIRTDLSGGNFSRHHEQIEKYCASHGFKVVEELAGDAQRWPNPVGRLLLAIDRGGANAVIIPAGDHLGVGLGPIATVALVIGLDSGLMWLPGGLAVPLP